MTFPGMVALFGSGETSAVGGQVFEYLFQQKPSGSISILETPAGFELNSAQVAGRVADFLRNRLQNYRPQVGVIPARRKGSPYSPENPEIVSPLYHADMIYLGAGSPTFAARQLKETLAWDILLAKHGLGAQIVFASAAAIAVSQMALPVYEIYKVGEDLHWKPGLDMFSRFGLSLVFVPHWNNGEGGIDLDTSCCFMGKDRFSILASQLPDKSKIIGIDEHTALLFDFEHEQCRVMGKDSVHLISDREEQIYPTGESFSFQQLGSYHLPEPGSGIDASVWAKAAASDPISDKKVPVPERVQELVRIRQDARESRLFSQADALRDEILSLGWRVVDTVEGPMLEPID